MILPDKHTVIGIVEQYRERIVDAANDILDEWDWDRGGCCGEIAQEIADILCEYGDIVGSVFQGDGEPHEWVVIPVSDGIVCVDIPWRIYESFLGYFRYKPTGNYIQPYDLEVQYVDVSPELAGIDISNM